MEAPHPFSHSLLNDPSSAFLSITSPISLICNSHCTNLSKPKEGCCVTDLSWIDTTHTNMSDVGGDVCCEYVLLLLVNEEAAFS